MGAVADDGRTADSAREVPRAGGAVGRTPGLHAPLARAASAFCTALEKSAKYCCPYVSIPLSAVESCSLENWHGGIDPSVW